MKGSQAEFLAKIVLFFKGYKIVASNYVTGRGTGAGEIDIIATRFNTIIFVEVKKRKTIETAMYAIKPMQQKRICNGIKAFLKYHPQYHKYSKRIDAFFVVGWFEFKHIKNAF